MTGEGDASDDAALRTVWVSRVLLDAMHHELIEQYGGSHGVHSDALIESALARPRNLLAYDARSTRAALAASLCFGLVKNHGYRDGNKRAAFATTAVFLRLNGLRRVAPETEAVTAMVYVATDAWSEARLADWVRVHLVDEREHDRDRT